MKAAKTEKGQIAPDKKESTITILSGLKRFPDKEIHSLLNKYIYNSDTDISRAAIRAAASEENLGAVPHLYRLIEKAPLIQKIEAVKALALIKDHTSVESLIKYFPIIEEIAVKREILRAVNSIAPSYDKVAELNRSILIDEGQDDYFKEIAVQGLVTAGDYSFLSYYVAYSAPSVQSTAFNKILADNSYSASTFLTKLESKTPEFAETPLGMYFCAYVLIVRNPKNNFMMGLIQKATTETISAFLGALSGVLDRIPSVKKVFRTLLLMPYGDNDTERLIGSVLTEVLVLTRQNSPQAFTELTGLCSVHLDSLITKIKKNHLSLKDAKGKEDLRVILLARLCDSSLPSDLIVKTQEFFKKATWNSPKHLIEKIKGVLESDEDIKQFELYTPLFHETDRKKRLYIYSMLKVVAGESPALFKRLNRVIKVVGWLEVKKLSKKIGEMLTFAREERMEVLESTCLITLSELSSKSILSDYNQFFNNEIKNHELLTGYIFGARYLPPGIVIPPLLDKLFEQETDSNLKSMILDTLKTIDLSRKTTVIPELIRVIDGDFSPVLKGKAGEIISLYGDSTIFNSMLDLTRKEDSRIKIISIRILREISKRDSDLPVDVFTNRLYMLLEDPERVVRVESLFTLFDLEDDYAVKILRDWLGSDDTNLLVLILPRIKGVISKEILPHLLGLIGSGHIGVQRALRNIFPDICRGEFLNEIRRTLIGYLDAGSGTAAAAGVKEDGGTGGYAGGEARAEQSLIHHPKLEFKFRREHSQVLTVFFIDIVGYTRWSTKLDMSSLMRLVKTFEKIVTGTIDRYNGRIIKKMGDGVLATFKHPVNAAAASIKIQENIAGRNLYTVDNERFYVRIGLHTGSVIRKDADIYGDVVNIASRMETSASPGEILITEVTYNQVKEYIKCRKVGKIKVKGVEEELSTYSPEQILVDVEKIIKDSRKNLGKTMINSEGSPQNRLRESLFSPSFHVPKSVTLEGQLVTHLKELFLDMSKAGEEIANDYHEEYVFKRYLQQKWNEMMMNFREKKGYKT